MAGTRPRPAHPPGRDNSSSGHRHDSCAAQRFDSIGTLLAKEETPRAPVQKLSKVRRTGLRREPPGGWPLDQLFVGVATLRTTRELFRLEGGPYAGTQRAWDVALWSGVTPQGSADSLDRLHRVGLVRCFPPDRFGRARSFGLDWSYPLAAPIARLFAAERAMLR